MSLLRRLRSAILLALMPLLVGVIFVGTGDGTETPPYVEENASDLARHAEAKGVTLEEAERLWGWHEDMSSVLNSIREAYPDDLASAKFHDGTATIEFSGQVPEAVQTKLSDFSSREGVTVTVSGGLGYNEADISAAVEKVHMAIMSVDNVKDAITGQNDGVVWSEVLYGGEKTPANLTSLQNKADEALGESGLTVSVSFSVYEGESLSDLQSSTEHLGGEIITTCTTAFTVYKQSNPTIKGVLTAAHCDNDGQTDDGRTLAFQEEHEGSNGDFQWHIGPQSEPDDFYAGNNAATERNRRDVGYTGTPEEGETVCRNGGVTHQECGLEIVAVSVCSGNVCKLAVTTEPDSTHGDSGGPVYDNNAALGIWRSSAQYQGNPVGVFARADKVHLELPVYISWAD